ncbi:MAG: hypothetical protein ACI4JK_05745 [Oscillospiraceae bacterium]
MSKYSDDLKTIVTEYQDKISKVDELIENIKKMDNKIYSNQYKETKIHECLEQRRNLFTVYASRINVAYESYLKRLQKSLEAISGKPEISEDLALISNPNVILEQEEFNALVNRHKEQQFMMKALAGYASDPKHLLDMPVPYITVDEKKNLAAQVREECISMLNCDSLSMSIRLHQGYFDKFGNKLTE